MNEVPLDRLRPTRGLKFICELRAHSGRAYDWERAAARLARALRASRRPTVLLRLADFRHEDAVFERRTRAFALKMPVEFFAEYRARSRALLAKRAALARLSPRAAPRFAQALVLELKACHVWFAERAKDYRRPWLYEVEDILAQERRKNEPLAAKQL